ncbi:MAG: hypothetical protein HY735_27675 [Verrucomicrobia bacterium]|nr:hypothetical protein [Verrucomicrobiota bacterium]
MNRKRDPLAKLLAVLMVFGVLATAVLSVAYVRYTRSLRGLQVEAAIANRNLSSFQQLVAEAVEYSKRNPKIDKIFQEVGINKLPAGSHQAVPASAPK